MEVFLCAAPFTSNARVLFKSKLTIPIFIFLLRNLLFISLRSFFKQIIYLDDEFLSIDLLSINGELVVSLFNGIGKRGMTKFFLNTSQIPKKISSGFYLIKLNGESARITKKVLYLK